MLSILFYIFFLTFTLVYFTIFCVVFVVTLPFDRRRHAIHVMSRVWSRVYFGIVPSWRVRVEGLEHIDRSKSYVVVVNHRSMLDILIMYVLPLDFKWVSKKEVYKWPLFGWVLWMHGDIAIERGASSSVKKMMREGGEWLSRGVSVIVFPEGSRGKADGVGRFREGAFALAQSAGAGILPCAVRGTGTAFRGWRVHFRNKFSVKILPAISPEQVRDADLKEMAARVGQQVGDAYAGMRR